MDVNGCEWMRKQSELAHPLRMYIESSTLRPSLETCSGVLYRAPCPRLCDSLTVPKVHCNPYLIHADDLAQNRGKPLCEYINRQSKTLESARVVNTGAISMSLGPNTVGAALVYFVHVLPGTGPCSGT